MNTAFNLEQFLKQATPVEDKYTRTPNYLVDKGYVSEMTGSALKCYVVINRFTDGFCRSNWSITSSFLQEKTGIKKLKTLTDSVRQLEQLGLVLVVRSTGETNKFSIIHPEFEPPAKMDGSAENGMDTTPENGMGSTHQNGGETTPENGTTKKETNKKENIKKDICEIFEFWKVVFNKNEKTLLSDKRARKIQARLVDGYQVEDIKLAITNCSKSDYHVQGRYTDIELICREPEKLDRFINMFPKAEQIMAPVPGSYEVDMGGLVMSHIHNIPMEQAVLTALMTVDNSFDVVSNDLDVECFFPERHKQIFQAIADLANENKPYDFVMVEQQLKQKNVIHLMGGSEYLLQMSSEAPSSFYNLESYVAELNKFKAHREVEHIGQSIAEIAKDLTIPDVHIAAESILDGKKTSNDVEKTSFTFEEAMNRATDRLIQKAEAKANKQYTGVKFNLTHLDNLVGLIQKGHFCIVGGRPGSGKSTLAQMLVIQTTVQYREPVLFVSAEMDVETFTNRCISALTQIPYENIHNAELFDGMLAKFAEAQKRFSSLPIHIEDKQKPTIAEIHSWARKAKRKYKKLGCIVIDYLQLVRDPSKKDRYQEVSSISRDLKALAKEFDCPVIALAQLNRESEKGKRPKASDLKESGQIEQDADQIILANPIIGEDDLPSGVTELIVAKNRHGKKGVVRVKDRLDICRFVTIREEERGAA